MDIILENFNMAMERGELTALFMIDMSAAFDTINHKIMLTRLEQRCGVTGKALKWISSYLTDRRQRVRVGDSLSDTSFLKCGVPQGSVLGPHLFNIYTLPIGDIITKHGLTYMIFADDNQYFISFKPLEVDNYLLGVGDCLIELKLFLTENFQKVNDGKTLFSLYGTPQQLAKVGDLQLELMSDCIISVSTGVWNLGVIFDPSLTFQWHRSLY